MRGIRVPVRFAFACSLAAVCAFSQTLEKSVVRIDASTVVKPVNRGVLGVNVEWTYGGNGLYDGEASTLRGDMVGAVQELGASVLRFPGGGVADYYSWVNGIGPQVIRPAAIHGTDPIYSASHVGTHEVAELARQSGAELLFQTNIVSDSPESAAEWVRYTNAPFNFLRTIYGSPAPFNVKLWEIGNEPYLPSEAAGRTTTLSSFDYIRRFVRWTDAMKQVDPEIKVGAATGLNFGKYRFVGDDSWNRRILEALGHRIDFLCVHNAYAPLVTEDADLEFDDVYYAMLAFPVQVERNLRDLNSEIETYAPNYRDHIKIAVTEWGPLFHFAPESPWIQHGRTMGSAVFLASTARTFLLADRMMLANVFKLSDVSVHGLLDSDGKKNATYYAMQLLSKHLQTGIVSSSTESPLFNSKSVGTAEAVENVPYVETLATLSEDGKRLSVMIINRHLSSSAPIEIELNGFRAKPDATKHVLAAPSPDANNGLRTVEGVTYATQKMAAANSMLESGQPDTVVIRSEVITDAHKFYEAPATSVTMLVFEAEPPVDPPIEPIEGEPEPATPEEP